ncbi:DNA primase [Virgibacillus halotolerans]|uniref:toprim domain-containing protein n=1 Tax=Virgibacillus halotolerans TaxID=1071053 RepID=UPI00195F7432|nr:toprim domain-containing protein [Virgibacillus halotolerans]MBM7600479.1 DNA primase [Virgibacillus halotolerans]
MAIIKVRGHDVDVDIEAELREYDFGHRARWSSDKLVASSPFRVDKAPSFWISLDGDYAGVWGDSGALDDEYAGGNFAKLLGHLRNESQEAAEEYLLEEYGALYVVEQGEDIVLPTPTLRTKTQDKELPSSIVTQAVSPYLITRGISADVQEEHGIGYSEQYRGFTAIPWRFPDGRLGNVKYRSTRDKRFFYVKGATQIRRLVFGMDVVNREQSEEVVLCEGEIDAMSWQVAGVPAIAIGGAHISRQQIDIIRRSPIKRLLLGGDNDEMGRRLNEQVADVLRGYVELVDVDYEDEKDANDVLLVKGADLLVKLTNVESRRYYLPFSHNTVI